MKDERRWREWITLVGFVVMSVGISGTFGIYPAVLVSGGVVFGCGLIGLRR